MSNIVAIIRYSFLFGMAALAAWAAVNTYLGYQKATGTWWERLLSAERESATILWGKFCLVLSAAVTWSDTIADALGQPEAKQYIDQAIGNPKIVGAIMLGITLMNLKSRLRSLGT